MTTCTDTPVYILICPTDSSPVKKNLNCEKIPQLPPAQAGQACWNVRGDDVLLLRLLVTVTRLGPQTFPVFLYVYMYAT